MTSCPRNLVCALLLSVGGVAVAASWAGAEPATHVAPASRGGAATRLSLTPVAWAVEQYTLDNGLTVLLHEDHRTPIVTVNLWYHVGSKDEPQGRNGFAHLFEHLMFQGSRNVGEDRFFKYLDRAGATDHNGTTADDRTNYYETLPSNQLELALWLESDRMGLLLDHVNQETFVSQREVVKNERRQNYENAPYGMVPKFIREALYPADHPYHRMPIGTPEDLDAATLDDVRDFFRTFYLPNNASLVVAGDIDKAAAKQLVSKYFASIPRGTPPPNIRGQLPVALDGPKTLEVEAEVELPRVSVTWSSPAAFAPGDAELDVLAHVLSAGKTSRLYKKLVYDMQVAQSVSAHQASQDLGSMFEITVMLKKGRDPSEALHVVDEELERLRNEAPSTAEIERGKTQLVSHLVFEMEKLGSRADAFNAYLQRAGDPRYFDRDVARYTGVTPEAVQRATSGLAVDQRVVTVVRPVKGAPRAGRLVSGGAR